MKVLHVLNELRPSGAEVMLEVAAPYWQNLGIEAEVLSVGRVPGAYAEPLREAGYAVRHVPLAPAHRFFARYVALLHRERYDAVHVHPERANFYLGAMARLCGTPRVVRTVHNVFAFDGALRTERRVQRRLLRALGVRQVSIGPSVEENELRRYRNPTRRIPNWYDATRFVPPTAAQRREARARLGIPPASFVCTTVGNCSTVKNHTALLDAIARLSGRLPLTYLHAGQEDDEHSERRLALRHGIADHVRFMGFVRDVPQLLHATDVFVMPSLYEGYGMSAIEAMGSAVPVVLADVPGLRDLRHLSEHICWAEPEAAALADALARIAASPPADRERLGRTLHRAARRAHSPTRPVQAYASLYRAATRPYPTSSPARPATVS